LLCCLLSLLILALQNTRTEGSKGSEEQTRSEAHIRIFRNAFQRCGPSHPPLGCPLCLLCCLLSLLILALQSTRTEGSQGSEGQTRREAHIRIFRNAVLQCGPSHPPLGCPLCLLCCLLSLLILALQNTRTEGSKGSEEQTRSEAHIRIFRNAVLECGPSHPPLGCPLCLRCCLLSLP
jgi:hypothetical protein